MSYRALLPMFDSIPSTRHFYVRLGLIALLTGSGICFGLCDDSASPDRMWALVIGISRYTRADPLEFAASDAQSFREFLSSPRGGGIPGDHIFTLLEDQATRRGVEVELEAMQDRVKAGDTVYIFIAGHGFITNRGIGYFIPSDGDMRVPASTSISFASLKELVELGLGSTERRILITDLCHAGRIGPQQSGLTEKIQELINAELMKVMQGGKGSYLNLLSSHPLEQSWESGKLKSGVFSYTLMEALNGKAARSGSPIVRARELVAYLKAEVPKNTGGRQTPMVNEDFDPELPLSYLDRPVAAGVASSTPTAPSSSTLKVLNADQAGFVRIQWTDPVTQAVAVRRIQWPSSAFQIDSLTPGDIELVFFDSENRSRKITVTLKPGANSLDLLTVRQGRRRAPARERFLPVVFSPRPARPAVQAYTAGAEATIDASLLLRLEADTQVYIDGDFFGASPGPARYFLLQGISPGLHGLALMPDPDREQRFRLTLFPGRQIFDAQSGELRAVISIQPPPDFLPLPPTLPPEQQETYRKFSQSLWDEKLVKPAGASALDYYHALSASNPAGLLETLRNRLVVAMGDRAQRILLKYLKGSDIRWTAEIFEEGAALAHHAQILQRPTDALKSQEQFFAGRALIEKGQNSEAVRVLEQSLKLDPAASHVMNALGLALWKQNLLDSAIAPLELAINLSPAWTYPRNTLGLIYLEQRRYPEAARSFQSSIELNSEDSMAYHCLGQLQLLLGQFEDAEKNLLQAIEVTPGNAYACETLGKLFQRRREWVKAERIFRLAIRLEPDEPSFRLSLAELFERAARLDDAGRLYAELLQRSPSNTQYLLAYATFLASRKRDTDAEKNFRQALDVSPADPIAHVRYGMFLMQQDRTDDAVREFRAAIRIATANPYAHHNLALAYLAQKKLPDAERELAAAIKTDPRYPAPRVLLADMRAAQKRYEEALNEYRSALSLSIDAPQRQEITEKIKEAEDAAVRGSIEEAKEKIDAKAYASAWETIAEALKAAPDNRQLRDVALLLEAEHPAEANPGSLPPCRLKEIMESSFWRNQAEAERLWREGQRAAAARAILATVGSLKPDEGPLILSVYLNLGNNSYGVHGRVSQWALRLVEEGDYSTAIKLMEEAVRQRILGVVPDFSPLTIDSLMLPPDNPAPRNFSDFEIAHHPDRHAHEAYAAVHAGLGNSQDVAKYLAALETDKPDLAVRMTVARVFRREKSWTQAISILKESLTPEQVAAQKDLAADALVLLADTQCLAGDCAAARDTLKEGLKILPENKPLHEALRKLKP
jgi:tetratricopeptide (TPR) repeat protein